MTRKRSGRREREDRDYLLEEEEAWEEGEGEEEEEEKEERIFTRFQTRWKFDLSKPSIYYPTKFWLPQCPYAALTS